MRAKHHLPRRNCCNICTLESMSAPFVGIPNLVGIGAFQSCKRRASIQPILFKRHIVRNNISQQGWINLFWRPCIKGVEQDGVSSEVALWSVCSLSLLVCVPKWRWVDSFDATSPRCWDQQILTIMTNWVLGTLILYG